MKYFVMPVEQHDQIIVSNFRKRGYSESEAQGMAKCGRMASWHGIRTHNGIKAVHLDDHLGSKVGAYVPGAEIDVLPHRFKAFERWNGNRKSGPAIAWAAMDRASELANEFGVGMVVVDNATHYLWGGGYVLEVANNGLIGYTGTTSAATEVVPFQGKFPTLGTNPHSWAFPTKAAIGFNIIIDWATSGIAWGRVEQFKREGKELPAGIAVDKDGQFTTDPNKTAALTTFGGHKGYGLSLIDELYAAYIGGSIPTHRGKPNAGPENEKHGSCFVFQVMHPEAFDCGNFAFGNTQSENLARILKDIRSHGNEGVMYPGQPEAENAKLSEKHGGILFTAAEIQAMKEIAAEAGVEFRESALKEVEV